MTLTEMGYGMAGTEDRILGYVNHIAESFSEITYVEIGVGEGTTLTAIARRLKDIGKKWRAIGVELPNGYSFSREKTINNAIDRELEIAFVTPNGNIVRPKWAQVTVYLKDSQSFITELWQEPINLALIDGCHGKPCATLDFLALEPFIKVGGIVMFHDIGEDQKGHFQPHCPTGLDVRGAVSDLGLFSGRRRGWHFLEELSGDRVRGGWDMGLFEKNDNG